MISKYYKYIAIRHLCDTFPPNLKKRDKMSLKYLILLTLMMASFSNVQANPLKDELDKVVVQLEEIDSALEKQGDIDSRIVLASVIESLVQVQGELVAEVAVFEGSKFRYRKGSSVCGSTWLGDFLGDLAQIEAKEKALKKGFKSCKLLSQARTRFKASEYEEGEYSTGYCGYKAKLECYKY